MNSSEKALYKVWFKIKKLKEKDMKNFERRNKIESEIELTTKSINKLTEELDQMCSHLN